MKWNLWDTAQNYNIKDHAFWHLQANCPLVSLIVPNALLHLTGFLSES